MVVVVSNMATVFLMGRVHGQGSWRHWCSGCDVDAMSDARRRIRACGDPSIDPKTLRLGSWSLSLYCRERSRPGAGYEVIATRHKRKGSLITGK
jgi:hypothetical protein